MTSSKTVKTRFCIISDTHNRAPWPATSTQYAYRAPLPSADVLLHAGDITRTGGTTEYEGMLDVLRQSDAELKIVIAGNHDITLDEAYYNSSGWRKHRLAREDLRRVRKMWTGEEARKAGIMYLDEGVNTFTLKNGAKFTVGHFHSVIPSRCTECNRRQIYTSPYTPEFCNWAFQYERDQDRYNPAPAAAQFKPPNPIPSWPQVDLMLTHGPPYQILDRAYHGEDVGCEHLLKAAARVRPRLHCFGHIHEGWGAERVTWTGERRKEAAQIDRQTVLADRSAVLDLSKDGGNPLEFGKETVFVNAAIMNVAYIPGNAPWSVDLDLPLAEGSGSGGA